jgi:DNA-directed RNA polymerase specialized sigma24 family protein
MVWADDDSSPADRDRAIAAIHACILGVCLAAGLARPEADDVAQDVWEWVLRSGTLASAAAAPWIASVTRNFILRWRRSRHRRWYREGVTLEMVPESAAAIDRSMLESNEVLETLAALLPQTERNLLILVRQGHTLAHAADLLGIPRGSRAYYGGRLIRVARRALRGRSGGTGVSRNS